MRFLRTILDINGQPCAFDINDISAVIAESDDTARVFLSCGDSFVVKTPYVMIMNDLERND